MTVRGIYSSLLFLPENYASPIVPIALHQNYSPDPVPQYIGPTLYYADYRPFTVSPVAADSNSIINDFSVTYAATGTISDFLDTAIIGRYTVAHVSSILTTNIDGPLTATDDAYILNYGNIIDAETDFSSVTIRIGQYENAVNSDLPWRRIPWTILGPLSIRN